MIRCGVMKALIRTVITVTLSFFAPQLASDQKPETNKSHNVIVILIYAENGNAAGAIF